MYKSFVVILLLFPSLVSAQYEQDLAIKLENVYKNATAVSVSFSTKDNGKVTLVLASAANAYKLTSSTDDFISDGKTVWHIFKKENKVIIDNIKPTAQAIDAKALLNFSSNYTPSVSNDNQVIVLTLTPHPNIAQVFSAVGGISSISFTLSQIGSDAVKVRSISALGGNGTISLEHLQIKSLKKLSANSFTYTPSKNMQVVDLRD